MTPILQLAILGRQPELGLLELESLVGPDKVEPFGQTALLSAEVPFDRLGGVLKLGDVIYHGTVVDLASVSLDMNGLARVDGKTTFGVSYYGSKLSAGAVMAAGLELKKQLKPMGPARLVTPASGLALTAAQLLHNRILAEGFELMVATFGDSMVVARTTHVQDIEAYSARDYGRPARSAKVGMLPPKLAQILLNSVSEPTVVDPFCGTGVVLQEALLAGRAAYGSDLAADMVAATTTNLEWLQTQAGRPLPAWQVTLADARDVSLPTLRFGIVSEGYLGPNLSNRPSAGEVSELDRATTDLYASALTNWAGQLASGSELAMCIPNWRTGGGWRTPAVVDGLVDLGYTTKVFKHVSGTVRYARDNQIVGRQLLLLTRT